MRQFLDTPGIDAALVIGRDGFVIESMGGDRALIELDALGASVAMMVDSTERMGQELEVDRLEDMFITFGRAVIIAVLMGDAILAIATPDASKLGMVRHKCRKLVPELRNFF
jgi:predicted regulator of Ras-like GTPase activity (Roadblock/LC7/MglB family)